MLLSSKQISDWFFIINSCWQLFPQSHNWRKKIFSNGVFGLHAKLHMGPTGAFVQKSFCNDGSALYDMYFLPRCEYWTILWWATGGANLEKNLFDSSSSLSALIDSSEFTLSLLLLCKSAAFSSSSLLRLLERPKGRNPKVAARLPNKKQGWHL